MQKVKKEIKTEVEIFAAEDGKEFTTQLDCEKYEQKLRLERQLNEVKKIEKADINIAPMGYSYVDSNRYTYAWFKPKSEQEIAALNKFFGLVSEISSNSIGEWVGIEFEGGPDIEDFEGDAYVLELDISLNKTVEFYTALGFTVEISKAGTGEAIASNENDTSADKRNACMQEDLSREIKTRPGDAIPTIEELLRQERVYIGNEMVFPIDWVKAQSLRYVTAGIERRKFYYEMPLDIDAGRFSDADIIHIEHRLHTSASAMSRANIIEMLKNYDRGKGDADDVADEWENSYPY